MENLGAVPLSPNILKQSTIGLWAIEMDEGSSPRMYVDEAMLNLIGLNQRPSPEEAYLAWYNNIDKEHYEQVNLAVQKISSGEFAEVQYPWHHPNGRTLFVRCGGTRNFDYKRGIRLEGTHQDISELLHIQKNAEAELRFEKEKNALNAKIYEKAILSKAFSYYKFNITKNKLIPPIMIIRDGKSEDYTSQLGETNFDYNEEMRKFADKFVCEEFCDSFKKHTSTEYLEKRFNSGNSMPEFICKVQHPKSGLHYSKYVTYLSVDDSTGDLMAATVAFNTTQQLEQENAFQSSIDILYSDKDKNLAIADLLATIANFYQADRAYIFESDKNKTVLNNTFEWCQPGIKSEKENLQNLPIDAAPTWKEAFDRDGFVYIDSLDQNIDKSSTIYSILEPQGISSLIAVPIVSQEDSFDFIGIDNPKMHRNNLLLLKFAGGFIREEMTRRKTVNENTAVMASLAADYTCVFLIDLDTDEFKAYRYEEDIVTFFPNKSFENLSYTQALQYFLNRLVPSEDQEKLRKFASIENMHEALLKKKSTTITYKCTYSGSEEYFEAKIVKTENVDEEPHQVVLGFMNIDQEVRNQNEYKKNLEDALSVAQSANRAKTSFLSNMSHDIRTPMNAIIGYTGLAQKYINDKNLVWNYLEKIGQSSNHLLLLINDVLDMSRIESGKVFLEEKAENLCEIIDTIRDIVQADVRKKNLQFFVDTMNVNNRDIVCDKLRLVQVLLNIVSNSIKYTPSNGVISIRIKEEDVQKSDYAAYEFSIKDNGIGMSEEFLKNIYEPFTRARNSTASGIQGTGLGMSIARSLVRLMNGDIQINSSENEGTEVILNFEFKRPSANKVLENKSSDENTNLAGKKILLVEDNIMNREIAIDLLEDLGMIVDSANDGVVAVSKLSTATVKPYDLIFMDIQMPIMNGYEATKEIRSLKNIEIANTPIVAMTANAFEEDRKTALLSGMNEHISKPINVNEVKSVLDKLLCSPKQATMQNVKITA